MAIGHFPADYGQGTGLSAGHVGFAAELNQMIAGGHPDVRLIRSLAPGKTIRIDPVNGDDHPANDGTSTPLKTLDALEDRIPLRARFTDELLDLYYSKIELSPGEHQITRRNMKLQLPAALSLSGSWAERETFTIDAYANDNLEVHKDPLTTPWTPGEFKEMFLQWGFVFGSDIFYYRWPIIDNAEHYLLMAWSPPPWAQEPYYVPSVDDEVKIVEPASAINMNGNQGTLQLRNSLIDGVDFKNGYLWSVDFEGSSIFSSRFSNFSYALIGQAWGSNFSHSIFRDCSAYAMYLEEGNATIRGGLFARCATGIRTNLGGTLYTYGVPFFKDCSVGLRATDRSTISYGPAGISCDNTPTFYVGSSASRFNVSGAIAIMNSKAPTTGFQISNGCDIGVNAGATAEASGNTFNVAGTTFSMANFLAGGGYNGWYEDQNANRVYKRV